ncbi:MAG: hypothetical protein GXP49_17345 [Deltaproteobacteria bacterium]|nr:hypothetical protein [Deltaproteobacteria bacterium]
MRWNYSCPKCKAMLNPDETIILIGRLEKVKCLMGFHPEPGNYKIFVPPGITVNQGDIWNFSCPVCGQDLTAEQDEKLCALNTNIEEETHLVLFSRVAGEKATFIVGKTGLKERHGEHVESYLPRLIQMKYLL